LGVKVTLEVEESDKEVGPGKHGEVVDKDMDDLHIKPSDAKDRSKWRKWLEGTGMTEAVTVMPRGEYGLASRTILDRTYSAQRFFTFSYFFFFLLGRAVD